MSTPTILVRAAPDRRVRLPDGRLLDAAQKPVPLPRDLFVERRLADGDLVEAGRPEKEHAA